VGGFRVIPRELQDEIRLHRGADLGGSPGIDGPSAAGKLLPPDVLDGLSRLRISPPTEEMEGEDVLGLDDRVSLELSAPVPILFLERE
jgi:hypothetical protein